jgi:hypothetical protein
MFIEMTIVLLISFEVIVEMHALGWISLPGHPLPPPAVGLPMESHPAAEEQPAPLKRRHSTHHPASQRPDAAS